MKYVIQTVKNNVMGVPFAVINKVCVDGDNIELALRKIMVAVEGKLYRIRRALGS